MSLLIFHRWSSSTHLLLRYSPSRSLWKVPVEKSRGFILTKGICRGEYTPTESSRVQSSPVRLTKTRQWLCGLLTMAAAAVSTHQQSRVESHESCRVMRLDATCSIFVSQTPVIGRDGCCLEKEIDVEELILLVKDHEAIYDASRREHRNRVLH